MGRTGHYGFHSARGGNVAMMFGLIIFPLFLAAGVAVDILRHTGLRGDLVQSADAGVLAAARAIILDDEVTQGEAETVARRFFDANQDAPGGLTVDTFDFVHDASSNTYTLTITGRTKTSILGVAGKDYIPFTIETEAKAKPAGPVEVAMVLDNTGSMAGDKLTALEDAAELLVNALFRDASLDVRIGLVPFGVYANIGTEKAVEDWVELVAGSGGGDDDDDDDDGGATWNGCVGSRNYPLNKDDFVDSVDPVPGIVGAGCPQPMLALTSTKSSVTTRIDAMTARGNTYIPGGLVWGRRILSGKEPFPEGRTYEEINTEKGVKALILLTDGANTVSASYPDHDGDSVYDANAIVSKLCEEIKTDEVRIYTIAFEVDDTDTQTMLNDCASLDGGYFDAADSVQLEAAFSAITTDLLQLSISK